MVSESQIEEVWKWFVRSFFVCLCSNHNCPRTENFIWQINHKCVLPNHFDYKFLSCCV